jgi:hypothetical protein
MYGKTDNETYKLTYTHVYLQGGESMYVNRKTGILMYEGGSMYVLIDGQKVTAMQFCR